MKKILKSRLFFFILGVIITGSISVVASGLLASNITYDNTASGLKDSNNQDVTTVQGAIDALYTEVSKAPTIIIENSRWNNASGYRFTSEIRKKYKYFKITNINCTTDTGYANLTSLDWTSESSATLNQQYLTASYSSIRIYANDNTAICTANIILFN